jgi:VanZ family protein
LHPFLLRNKSTLIPAIGWLLFATFLLCLPGTEIPVIHWLNNIQFDKWVHFVLFLVLVIFFSRVFYKEKADRKKQKNLFIWIAFLGLFYGFLMELVQQFFIPYRTFDIFDIAADGVGSFTGLFLSSRRYLKNKPL